MTDSDAEKTQGVDPVAKGVGLGCLGVIALVAALFIAGMLFGDDEDAGETNRWDAERVCKEDFIAKRLKAPATAEYDLSVAGGPVTYTVTGTVDSENSFGAMLRSDVTCVVAAEGDQWRLVSISGLD